MDNSISIGDLAAILTALGVSIYVVGLLGLAITIRLKLASTTSIAWYAVSLLPKTVVAGHGVRIWLGWPIVLTFVLLPAAYWAGSRSWHGPNGRDPLILVTSAVLFTVLIGGICKSCGSASHHAATFSSLPATSSPFLNCAPALTNATK